MKPFLFGVLLGVLVLYPALLTQVITLVSPIGDTAVSEPLVVAFALGLVVRPYLRRPRRWTA